MRDENETPDESGEHDRPGEIARDSGRALFGPDLLAPGPGWPFGQRARQRRAQRRAVHERAEQRRAALRQAWNRGQQGSSSGRAGRWAPVEPRRHAAVVASMAAVVVGLGALSWWASSDSDPAPTSEGAPAAAPSSSPSPDSSTSPPSPGESGQRLQLDPVAPIPSDGVAPIVPDTHDGTGPDPQQVHTVPPPAAEPSQAALSSPESAAAGWMAQWCPFDYRAGFAAQERARPWMTEHGWDTVDPHDNPRAAASWQRTVAAAESAQCSRPQARVVPEAPRSDSSAIVQVTADRVVTGRQGQYVEPLSQRRIVQRGPDGLWRVDAATHGGES